MLPSRGTLGVGAVERVDKVTDRYRFRAVSRACGEAAQAVCRSYKLERSWPVEPVGWTSPKSKVPDAVGSGQSLAICRVLRFSMDLEAESSPTVEMD
jgi:hypothetical protein